MRFRLLDTSAFRRNCKSISRLRHMLLRLGAGFHTVESLAHAPVKELAAVKGISEAKVNKFKDIGG